MKNFIKDFKMGDWMDISTEEYRIYHYKDLDVKIDKPVKLLVKVSGEGHSHRILCADGTSHYIVPGWKHLEWFAPEQPFSF